MNCREFESVRGDLARESLTVADVRESAARHAESCKDCSRRLADERALAAGLSALSASDAQLEAPAHIEAALIEEFRKQSSASYEPAVAAKRGLTFRIGWAAAAVAATLLVVFALSASRVEQTVPDGIEARDNKPGPTEKKEKEKPEPENKREQPAPPKKKRLILLQAGLNSSKPARKKATRAVGPTDTRSDEIATRFLPLTFGGNLDQIDGGQLVRVEMPRSALISFGLPMNIERANERIKADVLIGNDGVAHAIRFVR
jgi:hypothetical protein